IKGCDSIVVTQLTVNPTYSVNNAQSICNGGSYVFNAHTYISAGTYRDTLHTIKGCDSIIVTQLTVNPKPNTSSVSGNANPMINSTENYNVINSTGSMYYWIIENGTQLSGSTSNSISVLWSTAGNAKVRVVEINNNGCKGDTVSKAATVLPVKLVSFTGKQQNNDVVLSWSTASELNNNHFIVERSLDQQHFEAIGTVNGNGTTSNISQYTFTDEQVLSDLLISRSGAAIYYRLIQEDYDGEKSASRIIAVMPEMSIQMDVTIMPNPFCKQLVLSIHQDEAGDAAIKVTDMNGRTMYTERLDLKKGETIIDLSLWAAGAPAGIYTIQMIKREGVISKQIVKVN
ncbi:MAG: T9SS type A sorting domain-containing protein, partial [Bacteroidota bacterium]